MFVDYFSGIFTTKSNLEMEKTLGAVERRMIDEMLSTLSQPFTEEDVTKALFQMHPCKVPGLDGMSTIKKNWGVVGFPSVLNHTFIAIISKVKNPGVWLSFVPLAYVMYLLRLLQRLLLIDLSCFCLLA